MERLVSYGNGESPLPQLPAGTHSSPAAFLSGGCPCLPPRRRSEASCDWATDGSTRVCLQTRGKIKETGESQFLRLYVCISVCM